MIRKTPVQISWQFMLVEDDRLILRCDQDVYGKVAPGEFPRRKHNRVGNVEVICAVALRLPMPDVQGIRRVCPVEGERLVARRQPEARDVIVLVGDVPQDAEAVLQAHKLALVALGIAGESTFCFETLRHIL